jgi:hypothetical protein
VSHLTTMGKKEFLREFPAQQKRQKARKPYGAMKSKAKAKDWGLTRKAVRKLRGPEESEE